MLYKEIIKEISDVVEGLIIWKLPLSSLNSVFKMI